MTKQNIRLTTINIALMAMLVTALIGVGWQSVGAQEDPTPEGSTSGPVEVPEDDHGCEFDDIGFIDTNYVDVAAIIGIDEEAYWKEVSSGKSIAEIATENDVDPQKVIDEMVAEEQTWIDELLAAGDITEEEAAEWSAENLKYITFDVNNSYVDPFSVAIQTIGIDEEAFWNELESGKSVAEIAQANGVDAQSVIDAVVAAENSQIDKEVEAGLLTEEEAQEWRDEVAKYTADSINLSLDELDALFEDEFDEFEDFDMIEGDYVDPYSVAAKAIGVDEETFWNELESGKSVADIAKANGVEPQAVIDAVVAAENDLIDKEVAAGYLTEEEAQEWRDEVTKYVTDSVNLTLDELEAQFEAKFEDFEDEDFDLDFEDAENDDEPEGSETDSE